MEANIVELNSKRFLILEDILKKIRGWDKTYEMGIAIIEGIEVSLETLKSINTSIATISGSSPSDETYRDKMLLVVEEYQNLLDKLEVEKAKLLKLIKEISLKDKVKNSYILKDRQSVFIDKNL